jgi:hypothetical protein
MYHHKQRLSFIRMTYSLASAVLAVVVWWSVSGARVIPMIGLAVAGAVFYAIFLSSLTIEVNGKELRWYRGPRPFWPHRLSLDEIQTVAVVRNRRGYGLGFPFSGKIHGFWLYNVSGFDAVELRLKSGDVYRLGTDDPEGLSAALKRR